MCLYTEEGLTAGTTSSAATAANAAFGVNALSLGAGFLGQSIAARRAAREQERAIQENRVSALSDARAQYAQLAARQFQEEQAAALEIEQIARTAARDRSRASLAALEAGTSGGSVQASLDAVTADELRLQQTVIRNLDFTDARLMSEREAIGQQTNNRITQFRLTPPASPSPLALAIDLSSAYLGTFARYGLFQPGTRCAPLGGAGSTG